MTTAATGYFVTVGKPERNLPPGQDRNVAFVLVTGQADTM